MQQNRKRRAEKTAGGTAIQRNFNFLFVFFFQISVASSRSVHFQDLRGLLRFFLDSAVDCIQFQPAKRDQFGRIQLHLSYDDYDGSLNVVVISAHGLQAKDKNGYSDPFARVELLPGRM